MKNSRSICVMLASSALLLAAACSSEDADDSAVSLRDAQQSNSAASSAGTDTSAETETTTTRTTETVTQTQNNQGGSQSTPRTIEQDEGPTDGPGKDFSMERQEKMGNSGGMGIEDIRVGSHKGYDRIVVDLTAGEHAGSKQELGWFVMYDDQPAQQGSGFPVEYSGKNALVMYIQGVALPFELDIEDLTMASVEVPKSDQIIDITGHGAFEGQAMYVVSLKGEKKPFRVFQLTNPNRIVVDIEK